MPQKLKKSRNAAMGIRPTAEPVAQVPAASVPATQTGKTRGAEPYPAPAEMPGSTVTGAASLPQNGVSNGETSDR